MSMSKRDYERLAEALGAATDLEDAVRRVATVCEQGSDNFNPQVFTERVRHFVILRNRTGV